jgi:hypothetical protein
MTARRMAVALGVFLLATAGLARAEDKAVHRGGGDGGGSHAGGGGGSHAGDGGGSHASGATERHPSQGAHSSSGSYYSGGSYSSGARTGAEARHPRPGFSSRGRGYYGSPYYYRPFGFGFGFYPYDSFYGGYYGYSPYYYSGYYGYSPYYYGSGGYYGAGRSGYGYRTGSLRLLVQPNQARVYVDGYYAGIVDDFDGLFQRLNISPGRHEIMFKLEGFRTYRVRVYVPLDQTLKIHYRMVPGSGAEIDDATAGVPGDDPRYDSRDDGRYDERYDSRDDGRNDARPSRDRAEGYDRPDNAEMGTLRVDVRPADASVYVDGDFRGTGRQLRTLSLPAGRHRIEIVRPGFRTVERDVEVRPGHTTDLGVDLEK